MVHGIILCTGRKNITQIRNAARQDCHLSSVSNFLNHSPWSMNRLQRRRMQFVMERIRKKRAKQGDHRRIIFFIVDDTGCKKDQTTRKMEGLDYHFSHPDGKSVWSHCLVTTHLFCEGVSHAWDFRPYFRESYCQENGLVFKSKNDLAMEMIQDFVPTEDEQVYVLMDSWYTSQKLIDLCNSKGFHVLAAVKTNRMICVQGVRISMADFAQHYIQKSDLRSVTVEKQGQYWVYEYEGPLSEIENVRVLLSWKNEYAVSSKPEVCLLCTDHALDLVTIQRYYHVRWNIETGYRYFKELLGFDQYQLLSFQGIQRYWAIQFLTYNFLEYQRQEWYLKQAMTLGDVVYRIRQDVLGQMVTYVYQQALEKRPLKEILDQFKLIA